MSDSKDPVTMFATRLLPRRQRSSSLAATACAFGWACAMAAGVGCTLRKPGGPATPLVAVAGEFHETGAVDAAAEHLDPWWTTFDDRHLDQLVREALEGNLELRQAAARVRRADALLRQAGGRLFPTIEAEGTLESRWADLDGGRLSGNRLDTSDLGGLFDWELDVWGRLSAEREARAAERAAAAADWLGARLLVSAAVGETWFEILEQREQLRLIAGQIATGETLLALTELRFGQGQTSIVDVLQQREQLAATRSRVPDIEARLAQLEYALDVLTGRAPGEGTRPGSDRLPPPPPLPSAGVPSSLLANRPDLVAARSRVAAADRDVAAAIADRFPRFSIGGSLRAAGTPTPDTLIANALGSVAGPVFDAGVRRAEVTRRQAELDESLAGFSQAFLEAVRDVETAAVRERKQAERVRRLDEQLAIAQGLLTESKNRYSQGLTDYLPVLTAVVTEQNLQRELLTSRRERLSARIALHRSLGGPMDHPPADAPPGPRHE